jgi:PIN domain nuclease of toxin-antitoxin system
MPARLRYLLDTHALIWAAIDDDRLGSAAARAIATTPHDQLAIADISLLEISQLFRKGALEFDVSAGSVFRTMLTHVTVLPITLDIALAAPTLALPPGDPYDRLIVATAKVHRLPLITKDANIADAALVPTVW